MRSSQIDAPLAARRFRQAGWTYLLAGAAVVIFTLAGGLVPPSRLPRLLLLLPGLGFVVLFGALIILAPRLWRRPWTVTPTVWLVRLLALTNAGRTILFLLNAVGLNVHILRSSGPAFFIVRTAPEPLFLVNAGLTGLITFMLIRAGWMPGARSGDRL
ncbi:MAG: hypothetical protein ACE5LU_04260 [Anaerolineae bacterium]